MSHFFDRLLHRSQLGTGQCSQSSAGHAAESHIFRNSQSMLLQYTLGAQHSSLSKSKDCIERHIPLHELLHYPTPFLLRQCRWQNIIIMIFDMKLFQRIPISPQSFITITDMCRSRNMNDMLVSLAQQRLNHKKRHDVIVHTNLGGINLPYCPVEKHNRYSPLYHLVV